MLFEKSAGAIIFKKEKDKILYLLLHYPSSVRTSEEYWGFAKGRVEKGEKEIKGARREIKEETGLKDIEFIPGFKKQIRYFFKNEGKITLKTVVFYLANPKAAQEIKISPEHIDYVWLDYDKAIEKLNFQNHKKILKKANDFLKKDSKPSQS